MPRLNIYLILGLFLIKHTTEDVIIKRNQHVPKVLNQQNIANLAKLTDTSNLNKMIDGILVPRVVGTPGHDNVKNFIVEGMRDLSWHVELDSFDDNTPIFGKLRFDNIIATLNPKAERFLVLACHYDSKYFPNQEFLGATDSAVPCAMLMNIASVMNTYLQEIRNNNDLSIKYIFFDGEEAFKNWNAQDSIYGARHLAEKWEKEGFLPRIDMLVLLDLIGAPDPAFYSFFDNTAQWYSRLISAEEILEKSGHFQRYQYNSSPGKNHNLRYFQPSSIGSYIDDDHVPFLRRGVPILHLIPSPFPEVWHKLTDDREAIDMFTVENINKVLRIFIAEYLHLPL